MIAAALILIASVFALGFGALCVYETQQRAKIRPAIDRALFPANAWRGRDVE